MYSAIKMRVSRRYGTEEDRHRSL